MRLAQGRTDAADATIRRVLEEATDRIARARVLGAYAEIVLATGDLGAARAAADELAAVAAELRSAFLRAQAKHATGAVLLAGGEAKDALLVLREALHQWTGIEAPHEMALTGALVGAACAAIGDTDGAELAKSAARSTFGELRAAPDLARLGERTAPRQPVGLTPREAEVLRVLAEGKTNRVIAQELFISEKTVASHVSQILAKLGVSSRAAATAYAYAHDLV